jgi:ABC-type multidrug transport system ATPase subunit
MEQAFIDIVKQMVKEHGGASLMDVKKFKALLADYTKNEYKKQSRLLLLTVEEGIPKIIEGAEDLSACKKAQIRELEEEHVISSAFAVDIVSLLALVLRGDCSLPAANSTTVTVTPTIAAPSAVPEKNAPAASKKSIIPSVKRIELISVSQVYPGHVRAVDNINLVVGLKEFLVLLGPPRSGKSTVLRLIAGLDHITEGELFIDGELLNDVPTYDRNVKMVSQDYAEDVKGGSNLPILGMAHSKSRLKSEKLALQMTVYENMAFDLQIRKVPKYEIDKRVKDWAKLLNIDKLLDRKISALSLVQRWYVALGRSLVLNTKACLFDDPLAGIDAGNQASSLRNSLRKELFDLQRKYSFTMLYATQDRSEITSALSDRIIFMENGKVV